MDRTSRHGHRERGQGLVEFALLMPVVLLILMAMFDFGRAVYAYSVIANSAREGARVAITLPADPADITAAVQNAAIGLDLAQLTITVTYPTAETVRVEVDYTMEFITPVIAQAVSGDGTLALHSAATMFTEY